jgi:hypothetical protein
MSKKYFCRNCKGERNHRILHCEKRNGEYDDEFPWWREYNTVECLGCETVSFVSVYGDTMMVGFDEDELPIFYDDVDIYPQYLKEGNELDYLGYIPEEIRDVYKETVGALKSELYILTAGGLRAIIEATCNFLKIKKGNLQDRIDLLQKKEYLTKGEARRLHTIRFLGNDALHEMEKPKEEQLYILLGIINHLLENLFIQDQKIEGKMDVVIDSYSGFIKMVQRNLKNDMLGADLTLNVILGKSKRLFPKDKFSEFERNFIKDIESGKIEYLDIENGKNGVVYKLKVGYDSYE